MDVVLRYSTTVSFRAGEAPEAATSALVSEVTATEHKHPGDAGTAAAAATTVATLKGKEKQTGDADEDIGQVMGIERV